MATEHTHTEQLYVKEIINRNTLKTVIKSYCLSCGQKIYETEILSF